MSIYLFSRGFFALALLLISCFPFVLFGQDKPPDPAPLQIVQQGELYSANGILITGPEQYSLDEIRRNLSLDAAFESRLKNKTVVSVGEGFSPLLPHLRTQGIAITGVDIWYGLSESELPSREHREYIETHRAALKAGSVESLPLQTSSVDVMLSHKLFNNLYEVDPNKFRKGVSEIVRVLHIGGEAHLEMPRNMQAYILANLGNTNGLEIKPGENKIVLKKTGDVQLPTWHYKTVWDLRGDSKNWIDGFRDIAEKGKGFSVFGYTEEMWLLKRAGEGIKAFKSTMSEVSPETSTMDVNGGEKLETKAANTKAPSIPNAEPNPRALGGLKCRASAKL